jgi:hypothetical protein
MSRTVGTSILDGVTWEILTGPPSYSAYSGFWTYYIGGAYAYGGSPAAPFTTGLGATGVSIVWCVGPTVNPSGRMGARRVYVTTPGRVYRATATVLVPDGSTPITLGSSPGNTSNAVAVFGTTSTTTGELQQLTHTFTGHSSGLQSLGIFTQPGASGGTATVYSLTILDVTTDVAPHVLDGVQISYGRSAYLSSMSPASARFQVNYHALATMPAPGDVVVINANTATTSSRRFTGEIAAVDYRHPAVTITATTILSDLNRRTWGNSLTASETEKARFGRVLDDVGYPYVIQGSARATMIQRPADAVNVLEYLNELAFQSGALLAETRAGGIHIFTAQYFDQVQTITEATPDQVLLDSYEASIDTSDIINKVTATYADPTGPTWENPDATGQLDYTGSNASSIATYGARWQTYTTDLFDLGSATNLVNWITDIKGTPRWELEAVTLDASVVDGADQTFWDLANLAMGAGIRVPPGPATLALGSYVGLVLGWTETITQTRWAITYKLGRFTVGGLGSITWTELTPYPLRKWNTQTVAWKRALTLALIT